MTFRKILTLSMVALALGSMAAPKNSKGNVLDIKESITDSNIVYPESFETDSRKLLESWYMKNYTATDDHFLSSDVKTSDAQIRKRLAQMPTVIEMPFNSVVRNYIDRYTQRGRAQVAAMLGLSNYYMPIFEQALEEAGLPLELKYLPVVESALNPNAVSRSGATGLWQFMLVTGKGLGMEVNSLVDERRDPYVSSRKAAQYLKDLHSAYNDWSLAIAAYNCGPGTVNKAIRRAGEGKQDFWSIYQYLPSETRGYLPAFIAANYVMTYYPEHGINPVLPTKPLVTDTVGISDRVHFNQISSVLDIPVDELRLLNPQFRADLIPGSPDKMYMLILPSQQVHAYIVSEEQIRNFEAEKYARREVVEIGDVPLQDAEILAVNSNDPEVNEADLTPAEEIFSAPSQPAPTPARRASAGGNSTMHKVAAGETLASIAEQYGVDPSDIKRWNELRRNSVRVGQQLRISAATPSAETSKTLRRQQPETAQAQSSTRQKKQTESMEGNSWKSKKKNQREQAQTSGKKSKKQKQAQPTDHSIQNGENLTVIAKKYGVTVDEIKQANGLKDDNIRAGKSIKIPSKNQSGKSNGKSKTDKKSKKNTSSAKGASSKKKKKRR